jgi:hypothetical protein
MAHQCQGVENGFQLCSRSLPASTYLKTVRLGRSLAVASLEDHFEHPTRQIHNPAQARLEEENTGFSVILKEAA